MTEIEGLLFDGKNIEKTPVSLFVNNDGLAYLSNKPDARFRFSKIAASPRISNSTRFLTLPDGRLFETTNNDDVDTLVSNFNSSKHSHIHSEKWLLKLAVMFLFLGVTWLGIHFGAPALTYKIAMMVPEKMLIDSGQAAMKSLDKQSFSKSALSDNRQNKLKQIFTDLLPDGADKLAYKLHFRAAEKIGANAFALPSGDIVVTDDLINLSTNDDEIKSILLHEIAHVELRHAIQSTIQTSTILLLVVAATGDVTSISTLLLGLPALLLNSSYNRKMEWDADSYSLKKMKLLKINPIVFANMLEKLVKSQNKHQDKANKTTSTNKDEEISESYWSSHPPSNDRIERMKSESKAF